MRDRKSFDSRRLHPDLDVAGLESDSRALVIAKRKAARRAVLLQIDQGYSDHLPYPDASFDRVLSSFMFHHLEPDQKRSTLSEARRVLKPGGSFHMVDFGGVKSGHAWLVKRTLPFEFTPGRQLRKPNSRVDGSSRFRQRKEDYERRVAIRGLADRILSSVCIGYLARLRNMVDEFAGTQGFHGNQAVWLTLWTFQRSRVGFYAMAKGKASELTRCCRICGTDYLTCSLGWLFLDRYKSWDAVRECKTFLVQ